MRLQSLLRLTEAAFHCRSEQFQAVHHYQVVSPGLDQSHGVFFAAQVGLFLIFYALCRWPPLRFRLIPRAHQHHRARQRAHQLFLDLGLGSTRDRTGDCDALRLDLVETVTPTLIQRPEGGNMPSKVAAWVEIATGRLCKAEVRTRDAQHGVSKFEAVVAVEFERDEALGLTVPKRLREVFLVPPRGAGEGEATYSNYRRIVRAAR